MMVALPCGSYARGPVNPRLGSNGLQESAHVVVIATGNE